MTKFKYRIRKDRSSNVIETSFERLDADAPAIRSVYSEDGDKDTFASFIEGKIYSLNPENINEELEEASTESDSELLREQATEMQKELRADERAAKKSVRKSSK
jgi:hypothetical protein